MSLFKRNKNTEPIAGNLYPVIEGERLYVTVDQLAVLQKTFLDNCNKKGINAQDAATAIRDAILAGAYPSALSLKLRRNRSRDLYLLHGTIPKGVIGVTENAFGDLSLSLSKKPDGSDWPTEPDPDEPDAFYIKRHYIPHPDEIPMHRDPAIDVPTAQKYKDVNDRLSRIIEAVSDGKKHL